MNIGRYTIPFRQSVGIIKEGILDLLSPRHCCVCHKQLPQYHSSFEVCRQCEDRLQPGSNADELLNSILRHFPNDELALSAVFTLFSLYAPADVPFDSYKIIHAIKYQKKRQMAIECGRKMGELIRQIAPIRYDAVVPVPLHRAKVRERGYNQSELLALGVAEIVHLPVLRQTVVRTRYTSSQTTTKSAIERVSNVHRVFEVQVPEHIAMRRILLVDDVITTGSTLNMCALALLEGGAIRVDALALTNA